MPFIPMVLTVFSLATPEQCDQLYAQRGEALFQAVECYQSLTPPAFTRSMIALSAVIHDSPKTPLEIDAIERGLKLVEELQKAAPESGEFYYWRACMKSFEVQARDRGNTIPRATMGALRGIQSDLNKAVALDPAQHAYGPQRVLGIIHTELPRIVGGDRSFAEKNLKIAYENAPNFSGNAIAYAKILQLIGKYDEAKSVLRSFLEKTDLELNPYSEPDRYPSRETDKDRIEAKRMLESAKR